MGGASVRGKGLICRMGRFILPQLARVYRLLGMGVHHWARNVLAKETICPTRGLILSNPARLDR